MCNGEISFEFGSHYSSTSLVSAISIRKSLIILIDLRGDRCVASQLPDAVWPAAAIKPLNVEMGHNVRQYQCYWRADFWAMRTPGKACAMAR